MSFNPSQQPDIPNHNHETNGQQGPAFQPGPSLGGSDPFLSENNTAPGEPWNVEPGNVPLETTGYQDQNADQPNQDPSPPPETPGTHPKAAENKPPILPGMEDIAQLQAEGEAQAIVDLRRKINVVTRDVSSEFENNAGTTFRKIYSPKYPEIIETSQERLPSEGHFLNEYKEIPPEEREGHFWRHEHSLTEDSDEKFYKSVCHTIRTNFIGKKDVPPGKSKEIPVATTLPGQQPYKVSNVNGVNIVSYAYLMNNVNVSPYKAFSKKPWSLPTPFTKDQEQGRSMLMGMLDMSGSASIVPLAEDGDYTKLSSSLSNGFSKRQFDEYLISMKPSFLRIVHQPLSETNPNLDLNDPRGLYVPLYGEPFQVKTGESGKLEALRLSRAELEQVESEVGEVQEFYHSLAENTVTDISDKDLASLTRGHELQVESNNVDIPEIPDDISQLFGPMTETAPANDTDTNTNKESATTQDLETSKDIGSAALNSEMEIHNTATSDTSELSRGGLIPGYPFSFVVRAEEPAPSLSPEQQQILSILEGRAENNSIEAFIKWQYQQSVTGERYALKPEEILGLVAKLGLVTNDLELTHRAFMAQGVAGKWETWVEAIKSGNTLLANSPGWQTELSAKVDYRGAKAAISQSKITGLIHEWNNTKGSKKEMGVKLATAIDQFASSTSYERIDGEERKEIITTLMEYGAFDHVEKILNGQSDLKLSYVDNSTISNLLPLYKAKHGKLSLLEIAKLKRDDRYPQSHKKALDALRGKKVEIKAIDGVHYNGLDRILADVIPESVQYISCKVTDNNPNTAHYNHYQRPQHEQIRAFLKAGKPEAAVSYWQSIMQDMSEVSFSDNRIEAIKGSLVLLENPQQIMEFSARQQIEFETLKQTIGLNRQDTNASSEAFQDLNGTLQKMIEAARLTPDLKIQLEELKTTKAIVEDLSEGRNFSKELTEKLKTALEKSTQLNAIIS